MTDTGFPRRDLFRAAGAGALAMSAASYSRVLGANDKVQMGSIGFGGRGTFVTGVFQKNAAVKVVAICDVYGARLDAGLQSAPGARGFKDHRKLLEMKEVDAVYIATPDHWHAQTAIDALNAGKDVYVEKPLTLKIEEGPSIVKAARVNNRICQVGMQRRSSPHYMAAKRDYMDTGKLGKVTLARTWWHGNGAHLKPVTPALMRQPDNLDWARFLGPVKWRDYDPKQYANFRAYLEFGGGQVTDLFTHWIDVVTCSSARISRCRQWLPGESITIRMAARRRTRSTCCSNIQANSRRRSTPRSRPACRAPVWSCAVPKAGCWWLTESSNSTRWIRKQKPVITEGNRAIPRSTT